MIRSSGFEGCRGVNWFRGALFDRMHNPRFIPGGDLWEMPHMQTRESDEIDLISNYYTFPSTLLKNIVMCGKFP